MHSLEPIGEQHQRAVATPSHNVDDGGRGCSKQTIARSEVATISHSKGRMLSIRIRDTSSLTGLVCYSGTDRFGESGSVHLFVTKVSPRQVTQELGVL